MKVLSDILHKAGILKEAAEAYSSGGYSVLVRNSTTQRLETISSTSVGSVGGTGVAGRVAFWSDTNNLSSSSNLFWDNSFTRLGIGTSTPAATLDVVGSGGIRLISATNADLTLQSGGSTDSLTLFARGGAYGSTYAVLGLNDSNAAARNTLHQGAGLYLDTRLGIPALTLAVAAIGGGPVRVLNISSIGNVSIGTQVDAGFKLDVDGQIRASSRVLSGLGGFVNNCLYTYISNHCGSAGYIGFGFTNTTTPATADSVFDIYQGPVAAPIATLFNIKHSLLNASFALPQSILGITTTINQSATATGDIRGIYYNPTVTSVIGNHYAWESTSGKIKVSDLSGTGSRMVVADSSGVLSTSALPTSTNIYNSDGTLTGARTISGGGNGLTFAVSGIAINHTTLGIPLTIRRQDDGNVGLSFVNTGYSSSSGGYILIRDNGNYLINSTTEDLWLGIGGSGNWNNPSIALKKTTGNVVVGGTTDAGFRLDVQGTVRIGVRPGIGGQQAITFTHSDVYNTIQSASWTFFQSTFGLFIGAGNGQSVYLGVNGSDQLSDVAIGYEAWRSKNASAILDVRSTTKGFLQPRMTTTQRDAIATPATGLQVYNTTTNTNDYYNGTSWNALAVGNIYTTDGTLTGNRTVTMGGNTLTFLKSDNSTGAFVSFLANNLSAGVGIGYDGVRATGSNSNVDLGLNSKGEGTVLSTSKVNFSNPNLVFSDINIQYGTINSATDELTFNYYSSSGGGTASFRNTAIANGKTGVIAKIFGATGNMLIQTGGTFTDAGFKLDVQGTGRFTNTLSVITTGTTNDVALFRSTEPYITIEAAGGSNSASIFLKPSTSSQNATIQNRTGGGLEFYVNADYTNAKMTIKGTTVNIRSLPTSATGLSSGDIWNDAGTLKVA